MDIDFGALEQLLTNTGWVEGIIYVIGGLIVYTVTVSYTHLTLPTSDLV